MTTTAFLMKHIGQYGLLRQEKDWEVEIKILDVKLSYGETRFFIEPVAGHGSKWVNATSLMEVYDAPRAAKA